MSVGTGSQAARKAVVLLSDGAEFGNKNTTTFFIGSPSSVGGDERVQAELTVYPNPAQTRVEVDLSAFPLGEKVDIGIYDLMGRLFLSTSLEASSTPQEVVWSHLRSGTYILRAESATMRASKPA